MRCYLGSCYCYHLNSEDQFYPELVVSKLPLSEIQEREASVVHSCHHCDLTFEEKSQLGSHLQSLHAQWISHACFICSEPFSNKLELDNHVSLAHSPLYHSPSITRLDPLTEITINHLELTPLHPPNSYECTTRDQNSENEEQVKVHIFETHTESISFLQPSSIYRDWPQYSSPVVLVPTLMSENTRNSPTPKSKELDNHDAQAHNNNTVICPFCDQTYQDSSILQKHILATHNPGGVVGCEYCNLCFKTIDDQSNHIEYQHNNSCPKCYLCDLTFENFEDLGAHALVHSMQRLNCDLCSWSCTSMIQLNEHKQTTHSQISHVLGYGPSNPPFYTDEEANISCNICGLVLYDRNSWHLHNEYHHSLSSPPFKLPFSAPLNLSIPTHAIVVVYVSTLMRI